MALIERECVRRLLESSDPDTALVFVRGDCMVLSDAQIDPEHRRLVVTRRRDLDRHLGGGGTITEEQVDLLLERLENAVRDLGG
ncbi:hypothetical protein GCM10010466_22470 [Planomonospora alba]|uniref:Uncharacterized protein n=1 Tax=Planomonospora alba TaxID=161354 RepID=A0ABP6MZM5_9ACTN